MQPRRHSPGSLQAALLLFLLSEQVKAQDISARSNIEAKDRFEFSGRAVTNVQMFQRALLPGPSGAIVNQQFMAPIHQSLSAHALGVDSPMGTDSLEIQAAAFGQLVPGVDDAAQPATWDVSSAYIRQQWQSVTLSAGRQVVAGGAARYSRFDGGQLAIRTDFGLDFSGYGGLTALPRWDQRYGYHHLGDAYEDWAASSQQPSRRMDRVDQWMVGVRLAWASPQWGGLGVSVHQQAEDTSIYQSTLGLQGHLTAIEGVELNGDALFNTDSGQFSDVRLFALLRAWETKNGGLSVRGEYLHTVPSSLLSQSSVFSVFAFDQITEAGGEVSLGLPHGIELQASGYAQIMSEGRAGLRSQLGARLSAGDLYPITVRLVVGRLNMEENGYLMLRSSLSWQFIDELRLLADFYHYRYDELIENTRFSSFYAAHLAYRISDAWNTRLGASLTQSPYARFDLQGLAKLTYEFDVGYP